MVVVVLQTEFVSNQHASLFNNSVPDGVVLDWQYARREQLKLLVELDAPSASRKLESIVEDRSKGLILQ